MARMFPCALAVLLMIPAPLYPAATGTVRPTRLQCEARVDPIGIDHLQPRLTWKLESEARNQWQVAHHILVATRPDLLTPGAADLWDTGKVESSQTLLIPYGGADLRSNQRVWWTVRVWDREGHPSEWAEPATWQMAIVSPEDWTASWIAPSRPEAGQQPPRDKIFWIWHPEDPANDRPPFNAPPAATRHFKRAFHVPGDSPIASARLLISADNEAEIFLNGQKLGETSNWQVAATFDLAAHLPPGAENMLTLAATNTGNRPNPAGVAAWVKIDLADGSTIEFVTDGRWQSRASIDRSPPAVSADETGWVPARELALLGNAPWQNARFELPRPPLPILRKSFPLDKPVRRATLHVSGLGQHRLFINGQPATNRFLDPAWSKYEETCYYNTYDVTPLLQQGANAFGVMLGKGYYSTAGDRRIHGTNIDRPLMLILQAHLEYEDGSEEVVVTDESWRWRDGPIIHDSILGGTDYDARGLPDGWATAGFDDSSWEAAASIVPDHGRLVAAFSPPLLTFEEFSPVSVEEPGPGYFVYDFGQNSSAIPRLRVKGPRGSTLRILYAEQRHGASPSHNDGKGRVDQSGIHTPNFIEYTLSGEGEETWYPDFFYTGFQYLEVTGAVPEGEENPDGKPVLLDLVSMHVRAAAEPVGTFACSDPMYGRIDTMIDWAVRSNLAHVLTDCPQREKLGWLECSHLLWSSIAYRYDLSSFAPKITRDMRDSQEASGLIPTVAPSYPSFTGGFHYTPEWGAAGVLVPWYTYRWYGDRRTLEESFDTMKRFVDYMRDTSTELVPLAGLGDWYDYGHGERLGPSRFTPTDLSAMAIFHECARTVAAAAKVLGFAKEHATYTELAHDIRLAFNKRFYEGEGLYQNRGSPQTANAMALVCGLVEDSERTKVVEQIVRDLEQRGWQQTSGDVGYRFLLRALADAGRSDAIFNILQRTELGSYRFLVNAGWNTLPESWNANRGNSMNHCMLGHIQEWFVHDLAGIQPDADAIAFDLFHIRPETNGPITSASARFDSPRGIIVSDWQMNGDVLQMKVTIPVNTRARIHIPAADADTITAGGRPLSETEGLILRGHENGIALVEAGSGTYHFTSMPEPTTVRR
jgi:alpha-L-rhamnosidase